MPTRYEDIYKSDYLAPEDIPQGGFRGVTFVKAEERELNCVGARKAWKLVLWARTADGKPIKRLVAVNKTSAKILSKAWGKPIESYNQWLGKLADITHVQIKAFGDLKDAVLITPVVKAVEGTHYEDSGAEVMEVPPDMKPIQRPQAKPQPKAQPAPEPEPVETVDTNIGEVYVDPGDAQEQPLDEIMVTNVAMKDGKRADGSAYRVYFITCSDQKIYTSFDNHKADAEGLQPHQFAQLAMDQKRGVLITAEAPKVNKAGKEYYPIVSIA